MTKKTEEVKGQPTSAIAEYSATEAAIAKLRARLSGAKYEVTTTAGMETAKKDRRELVTLRTDLEKKRIEIKAPALDRCKLIDAEAKRITAELVLLEKPIDEQIKAEEERKAEIKRQKEEAEALRIAAIRERITKLQNLPLMVVGMTAADLEIFIARVQAQQIGADFQELENEAEQVKCEVIGKLQETHAALVKAEEEAARIKAEQEAEAARLEALRIDQEKAAEIERQRLAAEKAEQDRLNAIEQEKISAERAELAKLRAAEEQRQKEADEKAAAERAEDDRLAAEERAKQQAIIDAEREKLQKEQEKAAAEQAERDRIAKQKAESEAEAKRQAELQEAAKKHEAAMQKATSDHKTTLESILAAAEDQTLSAPAALQLIIILANRGLGRKS